MSQPLVNKSMFTPDVTEGTNPADLAAIERNEVPANLDRTRELQARAIGLELRSVQVMEGMEGGLFGKPTGVYLITTVVDGMKKQPITFEGKTYQSIKNLDMLPLGPSHEPDAAFNIYLREGKMPRLLSFQVLVLRSNAGIRQIGTVLSQLRDDQRYKSLSDIITGVASAANPALATAFQAANELLGLVGDYLESKPDDQLAYYEARYTNVFDNLGVGRHPANKSTMQVDKVYLSYEISAFA